MMTSNERFSREDLIDVFRFFRANQLTQTEKCFRRESNISIYIDDYFQIYSCLSKFIVQSSYQLELIQFLFPLFVHIYSLMIEENYFVESQRFYDEFIRGTLLEKLHENFFYHFKIVSQSSKHLHQCRLTNALRTSRFFLRLSMTSCNEIQSFLHHLKQTDCSNQVSLILSIVQENLKIDINQEHFSPSTVVRYQTVEQPMTPLFVHKTFAKTIQFTRLYTGVFPSQNSSLDLENGSVGSSQTIRHELPFHYRAGHSIDFNTIPRLGPHQWPSICLFTLRSGREIVVNCLVISHDCRLLAIGCQSSEILVCSMDPMRKLESLKSIKHLRNLSKNRSDPLFDSTTLTERCLIGHRGPIFCLSFDPNESIYLISGSEDTTIRLWHLHTWSCLCVYKMHFQPVLTVTFAPLGSRFASCSIDGLLCLWSIEKINPIRIYPEYGHSGAVYLVEFHPNSIYLASAHHDHTVHLWNVHHDTPTLVRIFNGHRHQLSALKFSPNGHFLGSACWNGEFILWDIQNNLQIAHLFFHQQAISCIEFSPFTGTLLLLASLDCSISLWNCFMITKMYDEKLNESSSKILLNTFKTKNTPIYQMRFSKENILYAMGVTKT